MKYLQDNKLLPDHQSAYRAFCSTETVIARVLSDIYTAPDSGDIAALALLDFSAAFYTVVHRILLHRLMNSMQNVTSQSKIKCWLLDIFLFDISYRLFLAPENTTHFPRCQSGLLI